MPYTTLYPQQYGVYPPYVPVQRFPKTLVNSASARPDVYYKNLQQAQSVIVKPLRGFSEKMPMPSGFDLNNIVTSPPTADMPTIPVPPSPDDPAIGYQPPYPPPGSVSGLVNADTWDPKDNPLLRYYMPPPDIPAPGDHPPTTLPIDQIQRPPVVDNDLPYYNNDPRLSSYIGSNEQIAPYPTYQIQT